MSDEAVLRDDAGAERLDIAAIEALLAPIDPLDKIGDIAAGAGIRSVEMVAWRDLEHPEAGGSEIHAACIAEQWVAAGVDVRMTTSRFEGSTVTRTEDGYHVNRPAGRYGIFPVVAARRAISHHLHRPRTEGEGENGRVRHGSPGKTSGPVDATVEIWNGMPFFSPLWAPRPRLVFLHHVHDRMWDLVLPAPLAAAGRFIESRLAPPVYRRTPIVTLSASSRQGIVEQLGFDPAQVHVVEPGVDDSFRPGSHRSDAPLVVAVGRLVPYKRFDQLIEVLATLRRRHPDLRAVIAGEGQERAALEDLIRRRGALDWISLPGRIDDDELIQLYQQAWVLASTSAYEGWGLTITEGAACGTPAVVSPISGHADAVTDGLTGFLAEPGREMEVRIDELLSDPLLRRRMQKAARRQAETLTWDRAALDTMRVLASSRS